MRKNSIALCLTMAFLLLSQSVFAQMTPIPDVLFETFLIQKGFDSEPIDGQVPTLNIQNISELVIRDLGFLSDLTGIEDMPNLLSLNCEGNAIKQLDISANTKLENLNCKDNLIESLDLSNNLNLTTITCAKNRIKELDLTPHTVLSYLDCSDNELSHLDLTNNLFLEEAHLMDNQIQQLKLSNQPLLKLLNCDNNKLSELDVSQSKRLEFLFCSNNLLTEIEVSTFLDLQYFGCAKNELTRIDISKNKKLKSLYCPANKLTNIELPPSDGILESLHCRDNLMTHLDFSSLPTFIDLYCSDNALECLNIKNGNNHNFIHLSAKNNPSLTCIQVDDPAFATSVWGNINAGVAFRLLCEEGCNSLGTENVESELVARLYPNPSRQNITVEFEEKIAKGRWTIYNQIGQKVLVRAFASAEVLSLDAKLDSGIYVLQIETSNGFSKSFKIYRE